MLVTLVLPRFAGLMAAAVVRVAAVHAAEGSFLRVGAKLLDVSVDLSAAAPHDCPAESYYRLAAREPLWLRRWCIGAGDVVVPEAGLALLGTGADTPLLGTPVRAARVTLAGIVREPDWWDEAASTTGGGAPA